MPQVDLAPSPVALIFDYPSAWTWSVLPQGADFSYFRLVLDAYRALRKLGLSIDILPSSVMDLSGYKLVLAPGIADMPDALVKALTETTALIGPRSNAVTSELTIPPVMGPALPGLDTTVAHVESLPPGVERTVAGGGTVQHWTETLEGTANPLFSLVDGAPVAVQSEAMTYLAGWPDPELWERLICKLAAASDLALLHLPEDIRIRDTATFRYVFNYGPDHAEFEGNILAPAGVFWHHLYK